MNDNITVSIGEKMAFEHAARLLKQYRSDLKYARFVIMIQRGIIAAFGVLACALVIYGRFHG